MLLSVIVPIYNVKGYVEKCLESLQQQFFQDMEFVLVDDGSTDGSGEICDEYAAGDPRMVVIHKSNGGNVSAKKAGCAVARGEYITFVDGDDYIADTRMANLAAKIRETNDDVYIMDGTQCVGMDGCVRNAKQTVHRRYIGAEIYQILLQNFLIVGACSIKAGGVPWGSPQHVARAELMKEVISRLDESLIISEDIMTVLLLLQCASSVNVFREDGYYYVAREGSSSRRHDKHMWGYSNLWKFFNKNFQGTEIERICREGVAAYIVFILMKNYLDVFQRGKDYFFPYPNAKLGSRAVIYRAGQRGQNIMERNNEKHLLEIIGVVDRNHAGRELLGHAVLPPVALKDLNFDCVIVAVAAEKNINEIVGILHSLDVPDEKIAFMDAKRIFTAETLPPEITD